MSVDFNSTALNRPTTSETDAPMFAPIPSWERNRKRRGFGGGKRDTSVREPTVFDAAPDAAFAAPIDEAEDAAFAAPPTYTSRTVKKSSGMAPLAIAAGIIAVGGLATAGWYAAQPRDTGGVAQLTPGTEATAPVTTPEMAVAAAVSPETMPATTPPQRAPEPAAATAARATPRLAAAAPARVRPAQASRSAEDAGVNTSATLPSAPQPYSGAAAAPQAPADAAPTPAAPPAWNIPPAAQSAAPPPVEAAPPSVTPPAAATPPVAPPN